MEINLNEVNNFENARIQCIKISCIHPLHDHEEVARKCYRDNLEVKTRVNVSSRKPNSHNIIVMDWAEQAH